MNWNIKDGFRSLTRQIATCVILLLALQTKANSVPDTVKVGSYIISIHDVNFHDKEYTIRFWIWLHYDNPNFDFPNEIDVTNAKEVEKPNVIVDTLENGHIWAMMQLKCRMKQNWLVGDFPFDRQHLTVNVENAMYDCTRLVYKPDTLDSAYDHGLTIDGWQIENFKVSQKINEYQTGWGDPHDVDHKSRYGTYIIDMDIKRDAWGLFLKIFIGMYIAFMISVVSFTIDPEELEPRFGLPVGGVFAAVGNKYIIDSLLPETSQFTLVDSLHTLTFMAILGTIVVSAIALRYDTKGFEAKAKRINRLGALVVIGGFVSANLLLILIAIF